MSLVKDDALLLLLFSLSDRIKLSPSLQETNHATNQKLFTWWRVILTNWTPLFLALSVRIFHICGEPVQVHSRSLHLVTAHAEVTLSPAEPNGRVAAKTTFVYNLIVSMIALFHHITVF